MTASVRLMAAISTEASSTAQPCSVCSGTAHLLPRWEHEKTTARWSYAQGGGHHSSVNPTTGIHYRLRHLL